MRLDNYGCSNGVFKGVDLHSESNNKEHRTNEITVDQLIVRRGQPFNLTINMVEPFSPDRDQLTMTALTGELPSEARGTMSLFGVPDKVPRSASAKAVWKAELQKSSSPQTGVLNLTITPPADAPIGHYNLSAKHKKAEQLLANLSVLFNPWCPDDWVFLPDEEERQEYVMSEHGLVYRGNVSCISPMHWDFGQFEDDMVKICMSILNLNMKHQRDPADDVSARCNPIYVSRVITTMINNANQGGILQGNWGTDFSFGVPPTHWSGSYVILKQWYDNLYKTVNYGQCWVFASVMCSVMRLLGIPCRVVTNFESAHDTDKNLVVDSYYNYSGMTSEDSVWNFHVWVEGWMRRPDLAEDGSCDGWQALDPTPQEKSEGLYCCGPASVAAIRRGQTNLKYDVPFVFAEVNADRITWLVRPDSSRIRMQWDTKSVGQYISTKAVGAYKRVDITDTYKEREGTEKERAVFRYALDQLNNKTGKEDILLRRVETPEMCMITRNGERENGSQAVEGTSDPPSQLVIRFEEVSKPINGEDVNLEMVLTSNSSLSKRLSINISVQATKYNGQPAGNIQTEETERELLPGKDLSIPIVVPFSKYHKYMVMCNSMNVSAIITDQQSKDNVYLAENPVKLMDPPISLTVSGEPRLNSELTAKVTFSNPIKETLRNCTLTVSGSGLVSEETVIKLQEIKENQRTYIQFSFFPYRTGKRTLLVDFDCSSFKDIKTTCTVDVTP